MFKISRQNAFAHNVLLLASSTALAQLISVGVMPLVTRLYSPSELGTIAIFIAFLGFWAGTLSLRFESALLIAESQVESHVVCRLAIIIAVCMSLIGAALLYLLQSLKLMGFELLPIWAALIATPIFMGYGFFMVYRAWALRAGLLKLITRTTITRSGAGAVSKLSFGFMGWGVLGLMLAELIAACASMLKLVIATTRHYASSKPAHIKQSALRAASKRYAKFPLLEAPSVWLDALAQALPVPLIAMLYGAEAAGWFGLARTVVSVPNAQIGSAIADVFQMELSKAALARDASRAQALFRSIMSRALLFGLVPLLLTVFLLPHFMPWVFGAAWAQAGAVAAALAPWFYAALVISPLSRALSVLQAQELKLYYDIAIVFLLLLAFGLARVMAWSLLEFCFAISMANVLGYLIYYQILSRVMKSKIT